MSSLSKEQSRTTYHTGIFIEFTRRFYLTQGDWRYRKKYFITREYKGQYHRNNAMIHHNTYNRFISGECIRNEKEVSSYFIRKLGLKEIKMNVLLFHKVLHCIEVDDYDGYSKEVSRMVKILERRREYFYYYQLRLLFLCFRGDIEIRKEDLIYVSKGVDVCLQRIIDYHIKKGIVLK